GILTTVILNVMRQLEQQLDDGVTLVVLVRRRGCPALNLGRQGRAQFIDGTFQRLQFLGRLREIRVVLHLLNNAAPAVLSGGAGNFLNPATARTRGLMIDLLA